MEAVIRLAMRMLALLIAATVVITLLLLARAGVARVGSLAQSGPAGVAMLVNWAVTLLVGPFAIVQLLRLKNSGRIAGAIVFGTMTLYYAATAAILGDPGDPWLSTAFVALVVGACTALLLTRAAREACE